MSSGFRWITKYEVNEEDLMSQYPSYKLEVYPKEDGTFDWHAFDYMSWGETFGMGNSPTLEEAKKAAETWLTNPDRK